MDKKLEKELKEKFEEFSDFLIDNEIPSYILIEKSKKNASVMLFDAEELCDTWVNMSVDAEDVDLAAELQSLQTMTVLEMCRTNPFLLKSLYETLKSVVEKDAVNSYLLSALKKGENELN